MAFAELYEAWAKGNPLTFPLTFPLVLREKLREFPSSECKHANQCENIGFDHISFLPTACQQRHSDLSSFCTEACGYIRAMYALQAILKVEML